MTQALDIVPPEAVTPAWITQALGNRGIDAQVQSLRMEAVGTGQLGETRRFFLEYRGTPPPDAPPPDRKYRPSEEVSADAEVDFPADL